MDLRANSGRNYFLCTLMTSGMMHVFMSFIWLSLMYTFNMMYYIKQQGISLEKERVKEVLYLWYRMKKIMSLLFKSVLVHSTFFIYFTSGTSNSSGCNFTNTAIGFMIEYLKDIVNICCCRSNYKTQRIVICCGKKHFKHIRNQTDVI